MNNDFIGIYPNAFSKEFCQNVIQYFEDMESGGFTFNRQEFESASKMKKDDEAIFLSEFEQIKLTSKPMAKEFHKVFWEDCYRQYAENYSILNSCAHHNIYEIKLQKTQIGGGFHDWHAEAMDRSTSSRLLVWTVYLNDVQEGGETEFLYQHKRVKPEAGTCLIWPAAFTHTHRGNPPISNEKYILTGWVDF
jgi:hypothetical protein